MCYLVSWMPPAASTGVRTPQIALFETDLLVEGEQQSRTPLQQAQERAASLLLTGSTEVRLWRLVDSPVLTQAVQWPKLGGEPA